jgi:DNA-binding transcriptional MerR regulator
VPLSRSRDYLSIGEVLESLRSDFPDVSISKIRFLEAEGLIAPARTESGYRKFYEADVVRLRRILALQRDQFLPLRVIKERLAASEEAGDGLAELDATQAVSVDLTDRNVGRAELCRAAGLTDAQLQGLVEYGILPSKDTNYDGDEVVVARAAAGLFRYGVEPRHLRMFVQGAQRESALIERIVTPLTKKRDPDAIVETAESARKLVGLSRQLRDALMRIGLKELL